MLLFQGPSCAVRSGPAPPYYHPRWDSSNTTPLFAFGHGLSFTNFTYSELVVVGEVSVSVLVTNSGRVAGAEVAQLYLGFPQVWQEPPRQLKGFHKTAVLEPGGVSRVKFELDARSFSTWDPGKHAWYKRSGTFAVFIGASWRDIRLVGSLVVSSDR